MNGTISKVISDKGFGFIQGEDEVAKTPQLSRIPLREKPRKADAKEAGIPRSGRERQLLVTVLTPIPT